MVYDRDNNAVEVFEHFLNGDFTDISMSIHDGRSRNAFYAKTRCLSIRGYSSEDVVVTSSSSLSSMGHVLRIILVSTGLLDELYRFENHEF